MIEQARRPSFEVQRVIDSGQAAVCSPVIAELHGGVDEDIWMLAGPMLGDMERRGTRIPFPDSVIAAAAVQHRMPVWTRDQHFARLRSVAPGLTFFHESAS
ncbi:MAG TPA: hypothetical protein VHG08_01670 [Longimicrobium sp.]|nr:hypothetical protein [Longimicrobium sp.]